MLRKLFVAAIATVAVATPVCAKDVLETVQGRVSYADLDLGDPAGVADLKRRIDLKARVVCTRGLHPDYHHSRDVQQCRSRAAADAKATVHQLVAQRVGPSGTKLSGL